jgi:hypothetical protein
VFANGGLDATDTVLEETFHVWSAWLTIPSLLLSQLLLIGLTIAAIRASTGRPAVA